MHDNCSAAFIVYDSSGISGSSSKYLHTSAFGKGRRSYHKCCIWCICTWDFGVGTMRRDGNRKLSWCCWTFWGTATFHPPYLLISWWVLFQVLQHPFNCLFMTGKPDKIRLLGNLQAQLERIRNAIRIAPIFTLSLSDGSTSLSWSAWVQKLQHSLHHWFNQKLNFKLPHCSFGVWV